MKQARAFPEKFGVRKFLDARDGAIAVEFAMIAPVFLMIVFGILMYGSYLAVIHGVQQLAAEAARSSIAGLSETERSSLANAYVSRLAHPASYPPYGSLVGIARREARGRVGCVRYHPWCRWGCCHQA